MNKIIIAAVLLAHKALAFPMEGLQAAARLVGRDPDLANRLRLDPELFKRDPDLLKRADNATQAVSIAEKNCGIIPCLIFDPKAQLVSTSGDHAYKAPGPNDIRGPCPGLNAAANHGYLPRNGIAGLTDSIDGLLQAYGMGADLSGFLAAYSIVFSGDYVTQKWSIGGPFTPASIGGGLLGRPQGLDGTHNNYEGDTSLTRADQYLNNGDAITMKLELFKAAAATAGKEDRITMDKFRRRNSQIIHNSITKNPYYFAPLFSTTLVAPAAYNFIVNFMSNHSASEPEGYLDRYNFMSFFAVTGNPSDPSTWKYTPGTEKIPNNWYRRTLANPYNAANVFDDLIVGWAAYPYNFRFGGNTGGVDTYAGIDLTDFTKGIYNLKNLFDGHNFACFFYQNQQQFVPDVLNRLVSNVGAAFSLWSQNVPSFFKGLSCPELEKYDPATFDKYPGATYGTDGQLRL